MINSELYIRQTGIIDPEKLTQKILIIGAGSIGGWTALCLGKLGCQDITVMDFDDVEIHNAGSQIYKATDDKMPKVVALQERLRFLLEDPINVVRAKWHPEIDLKEYDIVIAAVDNITVRKEIFEHLQESDTLYIDGRMAAHAIEIYTTDMDDVPSMAFYESTLFAEEDALPIACSERSVVYNVFVVAGMIGDLVARHANGKELPRELIIDLENFTMFK
jgi:molybdopterin/thiamine biosynthesis adenylyltransferase